MTTTINKIKFYISAVFPKGHYLYYIGFVSAMIVYATFTYMFAIFGNALINTSLFGIKVLMPNSIGNIVIILLDLANDFNLIFTIFIIASAIIDIVFPIYAFITKSKDPRDAWREIVI